MNLIENLEYTDIVGVNTDEKNKVEKSTLYLVATPIGNLSDLSQRAVKILGGVDFIAAEDTRNSLKLLDHFGIKKPMISYFEHNKSMRGDQIITRLREGQSCALITDAGTPAISDPGEDIVKLCADAGINVTSVPGCCAAICALTLSGLDTRHFAFEGFLEGNHNAKIERLQEVKNEKRTLIFYEAPHRLVQTVNDFFEIFGDRKIAICRELTKKNEEIIRVTLAEAVDYYKEHDPRGEYVLVLEGRSVSDDELFWVNMSVEEHLEHYIDLGIERMKAIKQVARDRGVGKSVIYNELVRKEDE